jgi:hypothetical protein
MFAERQTERQIIRKIDDEMTDRWSELRQTESQMDRRMMDHWARRTANHSMPVFSAVRVTRSLVLYVCVVSLCFLFCSCIVIKTVIVTAGTFEP